MRWVSGFEGGVFESRKIEPSRKGKLTPFPSRRIKPDFHKNLPDFLKAWCQGVGFLSPCFLSRGDQTILISSRNTAVINSQTAVARTAFPVCFAISQLSGVMRVAFLTILLWVEEVT
ncbi:hypothetical protein CDAR_392501 [Caerostris darwini]|uniref:Uncharacterized protein n=1 Tax=Caerostris darwini TaxID=1538125 RepID=A0AAV4NU16_9ARAC|nr:hypothetical protein CDAR_392501 [Caerostris darwini]